MFTSYTSHESTNHPVSDQDQIRNPTSSSTSNYHNPLPGGNEQLYNFDIDDDFQLDDNLLEMLSSPNYQDPSFLNFAASFQNERTPVLKEMTTPTMGTISSCGSINSTNLPPPTNLERMHDGSKIALRMKSERDIVDDGYRWRKYGKKKVKSSPNPRNYYRCWVVGCNVKKRVERDRDDSSYVITTYEGVHNHNHLSMIHYNNIHPREWNFGSS